MPISLNDLREKTSEVKLYDGQLTVKYRLNPNHTLADEAVREQAVVDQDMHLSNRLTAQMVAKTVVSWDLTDEFGQIVGLSEDELYEKVPTNVLIDILDKIAENRRLGKRKSRG